MGPEILLMVLAASVAGAAIGTFTGMVPGIHVNTLAAMMLAAYPSIEATMPGSLDPTFVPTVVSCCIMSASAVHSFVDFVPSAFIGAPDGEDSLSVLPAHRLLLRGEGMRAVRAAAVGSAVGAGSALILAIPMQWILLQGASDILDTMTFGILAVTMTVIILSSGRKLVSLMLALAAGFLGLAAMEMGLPCNGIMGEGTMLFPLLTGLFGIPPLLEACSSAHIPEQRDDCRDPVGPRSGLKGVIVGCIAGWFPGITSTAGAALASSVSKSTDPARFISLTASIGTVTSVFSIVTLSVSGSGRSGTSLAVKEIIGDALQGFCSESFLLILVSVAVASAIGYGVTIAAGKGMSRLMGSAPTEKLNDCVLVVITVLVLLLTGPWGLVMLVMSAAVGMLPERFGVARMCLTSCLMMPVLMTQIGISDGVLAFLGWPI